MALNLEGKAVRKLQLPVSLSNSPIRVVSANEGDSERMLQVQLYNNGGIIDITDGVYKTAVLSATIDNTTYSVIYNITTEDNTTVSNEGKPIADYSGYLEKNYLYLDIPSDILISGRVICQLTLYEDYVNASDDSSRRLAAQKFYIDVKGQYVAESFSDLLTSFNALQNSFTELKKDVEDSVVYNLHLVDSNGHEKAISVGHLDFTSTALLKGGN